MENFDEGLRCQDVHSGLRNIDQNAPLISPLNDTRVVGMAATLAGLIRGHDVIPDAQALMTVAAHQLDVDMLAFNEVVNLLQDAGFVDGVQRKGNRITTFTENVPYYDDLYTTLGDAWRDRDPTELEQQVLVVVDGLAKGPLPLESMEKTYDLDHAAVDQVLRVANGAGLVKTLRTIDGDLAYSPFFGFEHPDQLSDLISDHSSDRLVSEFAAVRAKQGLAINPQDHPLLTGAVARGIVMAPSVRLPNGNMQAFAAMPYVADHQLLTGRKPVLDKALAVLACLRCAETASEHNTLDAEGLINVIDKLLDPYRGFLNPHSAHERQYELIRNAGLIVFDPDTLPGGNWVTPRFVDTEDNREALHLARDLILHGEFVENRIDDSTAQKALQAGTSYTAPMQTTHRMRHEANLGAKEFGELMRSALGQRSL